MMEVLYRIYRGDHRDNCDQPEWSKEFCAKSIRRWISISGNDFLGILLRPEIFLNFLFLGLCASAMGFLLWNLATKWIGAIKTSIYIYVSPVITVILSVLILHEKITVISIIGTVLILIGLVISQKN